MMTTVDAAAANDEAVTEYVGAAYGLIIVEHSHSLNAHETVTTAAIGLILPKHVVHTALGYSGSLPPVASSKPLPG